MRSRQKVSNPGFCLLLHRMGLKTTAARKGKEQTTRFLVGYLNSHPESTSSEIVADGKREGFSRASIFRHLRALIDDRLVGKAHGRYRLGRIEVPELAIESEVERIYAILRSSQLPDAAILEAARQLARESSHASPRSREVIELLRFVAGAPKEIRIAILPFAFRTMRAAVRDEATGTKPRQTQEGPVEARAGEGYPRRLWEVVRGLIDPFLRASDGSGTIAWNTVYEAVDASGLLGDEELQGLADLAVDVEMHTPLPPPSAARAVLRRAAKEARLRDSIRLHLLRRLEHTKSGTRKAQGLELVREIDVGPFGPRNPKESAEPRA